MGLTDGPIWITEAEVVSLIDLGEAISVVQQVFLEQAAERATNMQKTQAKIGESSLHAVGGGLVDGSFIGTKTWSHTPGGATPILLLWDLEDGALLAVIEAHALGQYRTAAVSAVATACLAVKNGDELAILGTGTQALIQVAAVNAVRPLGLVTVWSPREASRAAMVKRVEDALSVKCRAAGTAAEAVADADIITLITRARQPFLTTTAPKHGAHVNAIGAISLDRAEFEPALLERCALVAADDVPTAQIAARELRDYYGRNWSAVRTLADVVASAGRPPDADLTLVKAMGTGIADVAIARFIYRQAVENNLGQVLPPPARSRPRLRASVDRSAVGYV